MTNPFLRVIVMIRVAGIIAGFYGVVAFAHHQLMIVATLATASNVGITLSDGPMQSLAAAWVYNCIHDLIWIVAGGTLFVTSAHLARFVIKDIVAVE